MGRTLLAPGGARSLPIPNIITGGHDNKTARTVAVYQGEKINKRALSPMFGQIIANKRAGGRLNVKAPRWPSMGA